MSKSVNKVFLLGHAGKDPEVRMARSGIVVNLSLATNERYPDGRGGWQDRVEWHNLVAFRRNAEILRDYVRRGSMIYVEGKLHTDSWDDRDTGERKYKTKVVVLDVSLLSFADSQRGSDEDFHKDYDDSLAQYGHIPDHDISRQEIPY